MIYLDNAATTELSEPVLRVMDETAREFFGNPSSLYRAGYAAARRLLRARKELSGVFGCLPEEWYFTASGTEANNLAVLGAARARKHFGDEVVITGYEHPSVSETAGALADEGFRVLTVNPGRDGAVRPEDILALTGKTTALVAVMSVNNETGAVTDVPALAAGIKDINPRTAVHCDHVQGFLKADMKLADTAVDTASVSAHKLHGPKGIGGLYIKKGFHIQTALHGGGQERGIRSGTENLAYAAAFSEAAKSYGPADARAAAARLNARLRERLSEIKNVKIHSPENASPFILCFSLLGFRSETVLHFLDAGGVAVSSGSACSKSAGSRTLRAMGLPAGEVDSALRVSFSKGNTGRDVDRLAELLIEAGEQLAGIR